MKTLTRTAKIKLNVPVETFLATMEQYTKAYNFVCQVGYEAECYNPLTLHKKTYNQVREQFHLPSQLAISSRSKAVESLKSCKGKKKRIWNREEQKPEFVRAKCPQSKLQSIRYDKNSYTLFLTKNIVSILTVNGRKKFPLEIPGYFRQYFEGWKSGSAELIINKKNKKVYLHVVFEKEIEDVKSTEKVIGIDRGQNNLAATSEGKVYGKETIEEITERYRILRESLQKKDTKSAKRHLRKLGSKEKRFRADSNHCISKEIVGSLEPGDTIVLEKLTGIRENGKRNSKAERRKFHNWTFYQLEMFLIYKAIAAGMMVCYVNPAYTSKTCSCCGQLGDRKGSNFTCKECGFKGDADLNAAQNIRNKFQNSRAAVNQPIVSESKDSRNKPMSLDVGS